MTVWMYSNPAWKLSDLVFARRYTQGKIYTLKSLLLFTDEDSLLGYVGCDLTWHIHFCHFCGFRLCSFAFYDKADDLKIKKE